jgi:hypothetical protein
LIDGAQPAAMKADVQDINADFTLMAGHTVRNILQESVCCMEKEVPMSCLISAVACSFYQ